MRLRAFACMGAVQLARRESHQVLAAFAQTEAGRIVEQMTTTLVTWISVGYIVGSIVGVVIGLYITRDQRR